LAALLRVTARSYR